MWSDNESACDFLGFRHLAAAVCRLVSSPRLLPATIGIYGAWGSGKSSLLRMVKESLAPEPASEQSDVLVLQLNGWLFEGYDDARSALMETIIDELKKKRRLSAVVRDQANELLRRVNWLRLAGKVLKYGAGLVLGGPAGVGAVAAGEAASLAAKASSGNSARDNEGAEGWFNPEQGVEERRQLREFRKDFAQLLRDAGVKTLVVIIDDLDRCLPDSILDILEAIKLFLFVQGTAFLIDADESLVEYAVHHRFPKLAGERAEFGQDYLEKLIQFKFPVPPLGHVEMSTYMGLLFAEHCGVGKKKLDEAASWAHGTEYVTEGRFFDLDAATTLFQEDFPEPLREWLTLAGRLAPALADGFDGNPRQCKRFLNTLLIRSEMAQARSVHLDRAVLAKLMLLEYFQPETFRRLAQLQSEPEVSARTIQQLERAARTGATPRPAGGGPVDFKFDLAKRATPGLDLDGWLHDEWLRSWLSSEPLLGQQQLRPYFYFARDRLGVVTRTGQRLSPHAQRVLHGLLEESPTARATALEQGSQLSRADAAGLLAALAAPMHQLEDGKVQDRLKVIFAWVHQRDELSHELIELLQTMPDERLPAWVVGRLERTCRGKPTWAEAQALIRRWASSGNPLLKEAALQGLKEAGQ